MLLMKPLRNTYILWVGFRGGGVMVGRGGRGGGVALCWE